ncbi:MAG: (2Fe-2S)-binding protein [Bdellovibrionota bacterium]
MTKFLLNGKNVEFDVPEDTPLLWVIREEAKLTGTKFGCGKGLCGACTVHLNGVAIRSCITPIAAASKAKITTIEGLSEPGEEHSLQTAWKRLNVPQCGYCQSGQIMSAAALLKTNANPNDTEILEYMSGNICRCGTYSRIKKAIKEAAQMMEKK